MTPTEEKRCADQLRKMRVKDLSELAEMMEVTNDVERRTLELIRAELKRRNALDKYSANGIVDAISSELP